MKVLKWVAALSAAIPLAVLLSPGRASPHNSPRNTSYNSSYNSPLNGPYNPDGVIAGKWTLTLDEEFSSNTLGTVWHNGWFTPNSSGITHRIDSRERACYSTANAKVNTTSGYLELSVTPNPDRSRATNGCKQPYLGALVNTDPSEIRGGFTQAYGYFEARIKVPTKRGGLIDWPAFWTDGQSFPKDGEMDVLEGRSSHQPCFHFHDPSGVHGDCVDLGPSRSGFHVYGAKWQPNRVDYYYDGKEVGCIAPWASTWTDSSGRNQPCITDRRVTNSPMFLVLTYTVASWQEVPGTIQVDYVRVWRGSV